MGNTNRKIGKRIAIIFLGFMGLMPGCTDRFDTPVPSAQEGKKVDVWLDIAFAEKEDGAAEAAEVPAGARSGRGVSYTPSAKDKEPAAFDAQLVPLTPTKTAAVYPDYLYNLEIRQYNPATGACMNTTASVLAQQPVGDTFSVPLTVSDDCALVFVAWGTTVSTRLGTGTFANAQTLAVGQSSIKDLDPDSPDDMKKMPYSLYLPHVKITADGKIQNPDGTDVRVRLQRLAARVSFSWTYQAAGYTLRQIRLESVPTDYKVIPAPDQDGSYPSLFDPYTILFIPESALNAQAPGKGSYACWIPASVRGSRSDRKSVV